MAHKPASKNLDPEARVFHPAGHSSTAGEYYYDEQPPSTRRCPPGYEGYRQPYQQRREFRSERRYQSEPPPSYQSSYPDYSQQHFAGRREPEYPSRQDYHAFFLELQASRKHSQSPQPQQQHGVESRKQSRSPPKKQFQPAGEHSPHRVGAVSEFNSESNVPLKESPEPKQPSPAPARSARPVEKNLNHDVVNKKERVITRERRTPNSSRDRSTPPRQHSAPRQNSPSKTTDASYDEDAEVNLLRSQVEFYFSEKNLLEETNSNLIFYMMQDNMWVPLHVVCSLPKVRTVGGTTEDVLKALRTSSLLELDIKQKKVRRPGYTLPADFKVRKSLRRSVLVYGLPGQMTDLGVRNLLEMHGNILCVSFPNMTDGPDIDMGRIIMKKKLGDPADLDKLTCAFAIFESQSQANKCVKARSRSSTDGIRAMHKYDYNKVVKRLGKGMSPNASPLFTPTASPSFTHSEPRSTSLTGITPNFGSSGPGSFKLSPVLGAHASPSYKSRSVSRSPVVRSMNSKSPFFRGTSPNLRGAHSPSWKLEDHGEGLSTMRARSSSQQNRRVIVAKGPDNTKGFRWPRNPEWKSTRTTLDVLSTTFV